MLPLLLALLVDAAEAGEPTLSGPRTSLPAGVAATFSLHAGGETAFLDGCEMIELEKREDGAWIAVPSTGACDGSAPVRAVSGSLTLSISTPGPGEYRGVVTVGEGCVTGRPIAIAACARRTVVRTEAFLVEAPPQPDQR